MNNITSTLASMDEIIIKFLSGENSIEEGEALLAWIEASEQNKRYFQKVQELYVAISVNRKPDAADNEIVTSSWNAFVRTKAPTQFRVRQRRKRIRITWMTSAAASVLLIFGVFKANIFHQHKKVMYGTSFSALVKPVEAPILVLSDGSEMKLDNANLDIKDAGAEICSISADQIVYSSDDAQSELKYNTIKIPRASTFYLVLSDGTKVWLNSESELTYPTVFSTSDRRVKLKGEAYFEVTKQGNHAPFTVESGNFSTRVLGTSFNVSCYTEDASQHVTLIEGCVKVGVNEQEIQLVPGDQMKYNRMTQQAEKKQVDVREFSSWKDGEIRFVDMPLDQLALTIQRFYGIQVELQSAGMASLHFSGLLLKSQKPEKIISLISESAQLHWQIHDDKILLTRK